MRKSTPVELKLERAYVKLIINHPFFACILMRLVKTEGHVDFQTNHAISGPCSCPPERRWPECPHSMATDGKRLIYNPRFVESITLDEVIGVLAHEVMHVAGLYPWRRGSRKPKPWNVACDKVVNAIIEEAKLSLPKGGIPGVPDKSAEELYVDEPGGGDGGQGEGAGIGDVFDPSNPDGSALSEAERETQMGDAKVMVRQAANAAKRAGKLPAGLARLVDEALEPRVPWRDVLSRFLDSNARHDYSWSRPNRRYISSGVVFPSLWTPAFGEICVGLDMSGSVDQEMAREICSELIGCLDVYTERGQSPEITALWFDHAVHEQVVSDGDELEPKGGGGTSFKVVFDYIAEHGMHPRAVVMITDGYCADFGDPPDYAVLWILTETNRSFEAPFGEIAYTLNEYGSKETRR